MTLSDDKVTEIFCQVDTFCFQFHNALAPHILGNPPKKKPNLSVSEVITLMILFHHSEYRTMKGFYKNYVKVHIRHLFPKTGSYNRYVVNGCRSPQQPPAGILIESGNQIRRFHSGVQKWNARVTLGWDIPPTPR